VSLLLAAACSGSTDEQAAPIVPDGLHVTALAGGNGVLDVIALTLRAGPSNPELYAALKNNGAIPACDAALSVELFDNTEVSIGAGISGLFTQSFYRWTDDSGSIAACVGPGDVAMAALLDLSSDVAVEDVGAIVYRSPYFALDVTRVAGLTIESLKRVGRSVGSAFTGRLVNRLDVVVRNPSVTVFLLDRVGRPLGLAAASDSSVASIAPGGSWDFETNTTDVNALDYAAYPAAAFAD
jgi:hypothetical protein